MLLVEKWREPLSSPYDIELDKGFEIKKIIGYPHAGNDVFYIEIQVHNEVKLAILKMERHSEANLKNEIQICEKLKMSGFNIAPVIIAHGKHGNQYYTIFEKAEGERLSYILSNLSLNESINRSLQFMKPYGRKLAEIHKLKIEHQDVAKRRFTEIIELTDVDSVFADTVKKWLFKNNPDNKSYCFVHGDFHYANLLWMHNEVNIVLDWELSGKGWKEFDIAWAIILRPSQKFLKSGNEILDFLSGYSELNQYNFDHVIYCMVLIYQHFHLIAVKSSDNEYKDFIENEIKRLMSLKPSHNRALAI